MKPFLIATMVMAAELALLGSQSASAHGGEDHGDAAPALPQVGQTPRAVADTDEFELVAVLTGAGGSDHDDAQSTAVLTLYLDHFATNQPVAGATVEVESGAFKAVGKAQAPGVYTVPGEAFGKPGRYPLTISVQTADGADLLDATLEYGPLKTDATTPPALSRRPWLWGAGGLLLVVVLWLMLRRRRHAR